jgi:cystathionine beta-lyase
LEENLKHLPAGNFAGLQGNSVTLMAASKTFNIAGLGTSFAIIPNPSLRKRFSAAAQGIVPWANIMGLVATEAAFSQCESWYQAQIAYLRENRAYLVEQIAQIDGLKLLTPEATFLAWIDASGLGVADPQRYFEDRGIGPSPGIDFGDKNFVRINFGCPRSHLEQMFDRLKSA